MILVSDCNCAFAEIVDIFFHLRLKGPYYANFKV